jgi:mono/diheme cytochrome c family protein
LPLKPDYRIEHGEGLGQRMDDMSRSRLFSIVCFAALGSVVGGGTGHAAEGTAEAGRGEYLAHIMDCTGCHTPGALTGKPDRFRYLGGSEIGFEIPEVGVFFPPNITPDPETGLGTWSKEDIVRAVRTGVRPDGRELVPIMPWRSYANLSDEDARALATYLKTLAPIRYRAPGPFGPDETPTGPYLTVVFPE